MPLLRHWPGEIALAKGKYALVGHYGEPTGVHVELTAGQRLPLITVTGDEGPFWYVLMHQPNEGVKAA